MLLNKQNICNAENKNNHLKFQLRHKMYKETFVENYLASQLDNNNVLSPFANALFQSRDLKKFTTSKPFVVRSKKDLTTPLKNQIIEWFSNLNLDERIQYTSIQDQQFLGAVLRFLSSNDARFNKFSWNSQSNNYNSLKSRKGNQRTSQSKANSEAQLTRCCRIMCRSSAYLYFTKQIISDQHIFLQHLENISQNQIFEYISKQNKKNQITDNPLWFSSHAFNNLGEWLCSYLEKAIIRAFCINKKERMPNERSLYSSFELLNYYQKLDAKQKNLVLNASRKHHIKIEIKQAMQLKLINTTVEIFQACKQNVCKLETMYLEYNNELTVLKQSKKVIKKPKNKKKQIVQNSLKIERLQQPSNQNPEIKVQNNQIVKSEKQLYACESKFQNIILIQEKVEAFKIIQIQIEQNQTFAQQVNKQSQTQIKLQQSLVQNSRTQTDQRHQITQSHSTSDSVEQMAKKKKKNNKKKKKFTDEFLDLAFASLLEMNVEKYIDELSTASNFLLQARINVFQRIRNFIMKIYGEYTVDAKLFGSNAVGLALPNSDIDIFLTGFSLQTQQQSIQLLDKISRQLKKMKWVISCETYLKAKIPIIKLDVNPDINFFEINEDLGDISIIKTIKENMNLDNKINQLIKVDITIEAKKADYSHLGCLSTDFMKQWLNVIPFLNPIVLTLKSLLSVKSLNKPFKGGISSYCIFIMAAAFIKQFTSVKQQKNVGILFLKFLEFYSDSFENEKLAVSLFPNQPCYFNYLQEESLSLTIIDPLNGRVMTGNSSEYYKIKAEFSKIRDCLVQFKETLKNDLNELSNLEIKNMQKKKHLEKWLRKYDEIQKMQLQYIINS